MENSLIDFISDEVYERIKPFLNDIAVRDYIIRKKYKKLRADKVRSGDAIDIIRKDYPMLQWETVKKIATSVPKKHQYLKILIKGKSNDRDK